MVHKKQRKKKNSTTRENQQKEAKKKQPQFQSEDSQLLLKEITKLNGRMSSIQGQVQKLDNRITEISAKNQFIIEWIKYNDSYSNTSSSTHSCHSTQYSTPIKGTPPPIKNISYVSDDEFNKASPMCKCIMNGERERILSWKMEPVD